MKRHRVGSLDIRFKDSQKNSSSHSEDSLSEIIYVFAYNEIVFQDWLNVSYQVPRLIKVFLCHSAARTALRCSCPHLQTFVEFDCFRRLYCPDVLPPHSLFRSQQPRGLHGTIVCFKRRIWFTKLLFFNRQQKQWLYSFRFCAPNAGKLNMRQSYHISDSQGSGEPCPGAVLSSCCWFTSLLIFGSGKFVGS